MKQIAGARWDPANKLWHLPHSAESIARLRAVFGESNIRATEIEADLFDAPQKIDPALDRIKARLCPTDPTRLWLKVPLPAFMRELSIVKQLPERQWSQAHQVWEAPLARSVVEFLNEQFAEQIEWDFEPQEVEMPETVRTTTADKTHFRTTETKFPVYEPAVTALEQVLMLKRYSHRTIKSYKNCFRKYLFRYDGQKPSQLERKHIDAFVLELIKNEQISESYQSNILSAIKMFYTEVVDQPQKVERLYWPKKSEKLPTVLTENEVARLFRAIDNLKHRCILMLIYSAGLRLGESFNIRLDDLQPEMGRLFVRAGKGKKDRCTILSDRLWQILKQYQNLYKTKHWLFEGADGGRYSDRSVQTIFERAKERSGINLNATVHTLRHSFATHLLEKGVDLRYIQELLGHESSKATEIYTHITQKGINKIKSPLDDSEI